MAGEWEVVDEAGPEGRDMHLLKLWTVLLCLAVFGLNGCAPMCTDFGPRPQSGTEGTLVRADGHPLPRGALLERLQLADYVLIGEVHTNPCHHRVQARVVTWLAEAGLHPGLGLEMVSADQQEVLNRFNAGKLSIQDLTQALNWEQTWGHPFSGYRPVFQAAADTGVPLFALNIDPNLLQTIKTSGLSTLPVDTRQELPAEIIDPPQEQVRILRQEFERHQKMHNATQSTWQSFQQVQALWDTQMATRALWAKERVEGPVVVLAGQGHVQYGWGIAHRLQRLHPQARVVSLMPWSQEESEQGDRADMFFVCPDNSTYGPIDGCAHRSLIQSLRRYAL